MVGNTTKPIRMGANRSMKRRRDDSFMWVGSIHLILRLLTALRLFDLGRSKIGARQWTGGMSG